MKYEPDNRAHREALAADLVQKLTAGGFVKLEQKVSGEEDIYARAVPQLPGVQLLCYTSISMGLARPLGADAIRCIAVYNRKDGDVKKLFKGKTVNRVGELTNIADRAMQALRDIFAEVRARDRQGYRCRKCGTPFFTAKSGAECCAETCWVN